MAGVSASIGLLILAIQWNDSLDYLAESYFFHAQHQDATIGLAEAQSDTIVRDFEHLPGVLAVEPMRIVGANFSSGPVTHRGSITGLVRSNGVQRREFDVIGRQRCDLGEAFQGFADLAVVP